MSNRLNYFHDRPKRRVPVPSGVRIQLFSTVDVNGQNLKVFLVDGEKIRNEIDVDYVAGGHGARYSYIPMDEIWLDIMMTPKDRHATLIHEIVELEHMMQGMSYNRAHDKANVVERKVRRWELNPDR